MMTVDEALTCAEGHIKGYSSTPAEITLAAPVPAVVAPALPADHFRDATKMVEWREVMTELADDLAMEIDQSYPPERRAYPSEQRRYEREMEIVNRARSLLQSLAVKDSLTTAPAVQEVPMEVSLGKGEFVIWPVNDWNGRQGLAFARDANPQAVGTYHPEPTSGSIELGADDLVISFANVASAMVLAERLQYVIGQMIAVPPPAKEKEYAWECNECGAQEYTMSVGQDVIDCGGLACGSCGCDEFHKAEVRHD